MDTITQDTVTRTRFGKTGARWVLIGLLIALMVWLFVKRDKVYAFFSTEKAKAERSAEATPVPANPTPEQSAALAMQQELFRMSTTVPNDHKSAGQFLIGQNMFLRSQLDQAHLEKMKQLDIISGFRGNIDSMAAKFDGSAASQAIVAAVNAERERSEKAKLEEVRVIRKEISALESKIEGLSRPVAQPVVQSVQLPLSPSPAERTVEELKQQVGQLTARLADRESELDRAKASMATAYQIASQAPKSSPAPAPQQAQFAQQPSGQQMSLSLSPPPAVARKTPFDGMVYPIGVPSCEYSAYELQRKRVTAAGTDLHVILYRANSKLVEKKRIGDPDAGSFGPDGGYVPPPGVDRIQIISDKSSVTITESRR